MKTSGNTILVTGGSSGIGRGLAEALHDRGNRVIVAGRRQALLDEIVAGRPGMAAVQVDLGDRGDVERLGAIVRERFPDLNGLIANAGISQEEDMAADGWTSATAEAIVATNIVGVLRAVDAVLPTLKGNPDATLIATTSNLAFIPLASYPTYCASKAFLHSWIQSVRHQLRQVPVEVLELSPPYVQTELTGAHQVTDPRAIPLAEYISEVMGLLERGGHSRGEVIVTRGNDRRTAERDGRYDEIFNMMNPP